VETLVTRIQPEGRLQHRTRVERAILGATHDLLQDRAASEVTIADIMDAVGLSRTAFYRYFPDVNSVLVRLLGEVSNRFVMTWLDAPDDADFADVLRSDARTNLERMEEHGAIVGACLDARTTAPELYAAWLKLTEVVVGRVGIRLEELNRRGVTQVGCPAETARALVTFSIYYLTEGLTRLGAEGRDALAETLQAVWYRTIFSVG
jgi:AcrR family transcriptional regulator